MRGSRLEKRSGLMSRRMKPRNETLIQLLNSSLIRSTRKRNHINVYTRNHQTSKVKSIASSIKSKNYCYS